MSSIYPPQKFKSLTTTDGHVDDFAELFAKLRNRWVKVERLQEYDESDFEGYRKFKEGNYEEAARLVREMVKGQTEVYRTARERNLRMMRMRIYDLPLSDYLVHYEIPAYLADIECGEEVRFLDSRELATLGMNDLSDYVLFDDAFVLTLHYDVTKMQLREARLVEDGDLVRSYVELTDLLIEKAQPMLENSAYLALSAN